MPLYDLPVEVLTNILASVSSLSDPRALVSSSQHIYSVFRRYKAALIYQVLSTELGPVLGDALAFSHMMSQLDALSPSYYDQVGDAVATYGEYLAGRDHSCPWDVAVDYVLGLARTYHTFAYWANVYVRSTISLLEREVQAFTADSHG